MTHCEAAFDNPTGGLTIDCDCDDLRWQPYEAALLAQADFIWRQLALPEAELSLKLTNDATMAGLNHTYRGQQEPTNVLSFPAQDFAEPATAADFPTPSKDTPILLGDVVLAYDTLAREAAQGGHVLETHALHLLTHGFLHLLGYDHGTEGGAAIMEMLESRLLTARGFSDPYHEAHR